MPLRATPSSLPSHPAPTRPSSSICFVSTKYTVGWPVRQDPMDSGPRVRVSLLGSSLCPVAGGHAWLFSAEAHLGGSSQGSGREEPAGRAW